MDNFRHLDPLLSHPSAPHPGPRHVVGYRRGGIGSDVSARRGVIARLLGASSDQSVVLIFALSIFGAEWEEEDRLGAHLRWEPHAGIRAPSNAFDVR